MFQGGIELISAGNPTYRILYIADSTSIHSRRWIEYFAGRGHEISLITIGKKRFIMPGIHHVANFDQFYYRSPAFPVNLLKTRRLIRSIAPDLLHAHFAHQYGWLGALSGFHPFVLSVWGTDILRLPGQSRGQMGKWLTRYALKTAEAVTTTSEHALRESIRLGADPVNGEVIFWGVDTDQFRPDIDTFKLRAELNIPETAPVILSNRNIAPLYNNDIVIEAMARVLGKFPEAVLILQNAGGMTRFEAELRDLAQRQGISRSIRFLPQYSHDELPPLYALADVYVSVPAWDAGPVSLKEAMASHCTPVISDLPGPGEWVKAGENGLVVPVRNAARLADAIRDLLSNREKRRRFDERNRALIVSQGSHQKQMEKAEAVYHRLLSGKRVRGRK